VAKKKTAAKGGRMRGNARALHRTGTAHISGSGGIHSRGKKGAQGVSHVRIGALAGTAAFGFSSNATLSAGGALAGTTSRTTASSASVKRRAANRANARNRRGGQAPAILADWKARRAKYHDTMPNSAITNAVAKKYDVTASYVRTIIKDAT